MLAPEINKTVPGLELKARFEVLLKSVSELQDLAMQAVQTQDRDMMIVVLNTLKMQLSELTDAIDAVTEERNRLATAAVYFANTVDKLVAVTGDLISPYSRDGDDTVYQWFRLEVDELTEGNEHDDICN